MKVTKHNTNGGKIMVRKTIVSKYKHRIVRKMGDYNIPKKEPKFKEDLTPLQAYELEQSLGASYVITPKGIAALMEHHISLLPLESRARRTSLVGFAPEEIEEN